MAGLVLREDKNGLTTLTLNRPERLNALTVEMFAELEEHVDAIARAPEGIGLVVLRGAGKCFSSGHDVADIARGEKLPRPHFFALVLEKLSNLPQPVISAVHGYCYTGALETAIAADVVFATEGTRFADTHAKLGLTPIWGMTQRLPRRVGRSKALEMLMTARPYTGREAHAMGLVDICVPDDAFEVELHRLTEGILTQSWLSFRRYKKLLKETDGLPLEAGLAYEILHSPGRGPDTPQRLQAFLNRKKTA